MPSTVLDRARRWFDHDSDDPGLLWFRSAFGLVWLAYDLCDLLCSGTAICSYWPSGVFGAPYSLQLLQLGLLACEVAMICGSYALIAPLLAAALRALEAWWFLRLNDFTTSSWSRCSSRRSPRLRVEEALCSSPPGVGARRSALADSLDLPRHRDVEAQRSVAVRRPPPRAPRVPRRRGALAPTRAPSSLADPSPGGRGARLGSGGLGARAQALVAAGRPAAAILVLAAGIHAYGALGTNVWFFGASMVAQVALLLPHSARRMTSEGARACRGPAP